MFALAKLLAVAVAAEIAAGAIGAATHSDRHPAREHGGTPATTGATAPEVRPGLSSARIAADLLSPTDMGGYYRRSSQQPEEFLSSAPCLASLLRSPSQTGYGAEILTGPDQASTPTVIEVVASYPADAIAAVDRDVTTSIASCKELSFELANAVVSAALTNDAIAPVGDADQAWSGKFVEKGSPMSIQLGVAESGQTLVTIVWIDTVPGAKAVMGGLDSTLSLAIGKLA